jgi:hypothetical protein
MGRHLAAPIPAHGDEGQVLAFRRIGKGIEALRHMVVNGPHDLVDQEAIGPRHLGARDAGLQTTADLGLALGKRRPENGQDLVPHPLRGMSSRSDRRQFVLKGHAIYDRAPAVHGRVGLAIGQVCVRPGSRSVVRARR